MFACPDRKIHQNIKVESGQVLLIVTLTLAVILTIVLSIVSRSVTDVAVSSKEEESIRAFSAAEAGIERSLVIGTGVNNEDFNGAKINSTVSKIAQNETSFFYPFPIKSGDSAVVWFKNHNENGDPICSLAFPCFTPVSNASFKVCWGNESSAEIPALELSVYYSDAGEIKVARGTADASAATRADGFSAVDGTKCAPIDEHEFKYAKTFSWTANLNIPAGVLTTGNLLLATAKLMYNTEGHDVGFIFYDSLPSQGNRVVSTGTYGDANRKLDVFSLYPVAPSIFESGVFTKGTLNK